MFFKNKVKHNMYKFLKTLDKTNNYKKTKEIMLKTISGEDFSYAVLECSNNHLVDGFLCSKGCVNNNIIIRAPQTFYITLSGYQFINSYYGQVKRILWELFLIIVTAIVTVIINNELSNSNQDVDIRNKIVPQCSSCFEICDYSDD